MIVRVNWSAMRKTQVHEYATRFLLGGAVTAIAGLLAKKFGPALGGLFLAFPAIFPSSATLVEKHEKKKKEQAGLRPGHRGRDSAALDARGAALGSLGLIAFALLVWKLLPLWSAIPTLSAALGVWIFVSVASWRFSRRHPFREQNENRP